jgi:ABC-type polysaccharide/polyol phosphate export permease
MKTSDIWNQVIKKSVIIIIILGIIYFVLGYFMNQQTFAFGGNYTLSFTVLFLIITVGFLIYSLYNRKKDLKGEHTPLNECVHIFDDYKFLLKQLITRDFAVKYRRSYLGVVWVILNPLLQMIILSAVFSFIFRFDIEKYPVYLILGQVTFNFFSEATNIAVTTVVDSGQLIKKIYMPKYIFPLSKTMFSFLNFMISFIPVMVVLFIFRVPININWLYLPIFFVTLFMFTLGVGFFLAALNVKMRDTQYLYGIAITLLNYVTPIFYPVSSLSPRFQMVMQFNPLYQYVSLIREIMFEGITPSLQHLAICIFVSIVALEIGMRYFFSRQDEFILYV